MEEQILTDEELYWVKVPSEYNLTGERVSGKKDIKVWWKWWQTRCGAEHYYDAKNRQTIIK